MGFLTLVPSVRKNGDAVLIRDNFISRLNNWFLSLRKIEVIPSKKLILCRTRKFYLLAKLSVLRFGDIAYIDCSCSATSAELAGAFGPAAAELKPNEFFVVSLMTEGGEGYPVALYRCLAAEAAGYCGSVFSGRERYIPPHEKKAAELAAMLSEITGAPVGKQLFAGVKTAECRVCGREIAAAGKRCLYCGSEKVVPPNNDSGAGRSATPTESREGG